MVRGYAGPGLSWQPSLQVPIFSAAPWRTVTEHQKDGASESFNINPAIAILGMMTECGTIPYS